MTESLNTYVNITKLQYDELIYKINTMKNGIDSSFTNNTISYMFLMQVAYNLLETAGSRHKNMTFTLIKNITFMCLAGLLWWLVGFGFYWGESVNGGIGKTYFAENLFTDRNQYDRWVLSYAYLFTSISIVTSCVCERLDILNGIIWVFFYSLFILPVCAHWGSNPGGWLSKLEYVDLSGVGFIHLGGAAAGLAALIFVGPRLNRESEEKENDFKISNMPYFSFSVILFWLCRFGFNAASLMHVVSDTTGDYSTFVGRISMNVNIAAGTSGIVAFFINFVINRKTSEAYSVVCLSNGIIVGLISVSAAPHVIESWSAVIIGAFAAGIYTFYAWITKKLKLDDPIEAIAVNLTGGSWGLVAVGFLNTKNGAVYGFGGYHFGIQLLGVVIYFAWPFVCTSIIFFLLKFCQLHRINETVETEGADIAKCGGIAFKLDEISSQEYFTQLTANTVSKLNYIRTNENILTERQNLSVRREVNNDEINIEMIEQRRREAQERLANDQNKEENKAYEENNINN